MPRRQWYIAPADGFPAVGEALPPLGAGHPGKGRVVVAVGLIDGSRRVVLDVV